MTPVEYLVKELRKSKGVLNHYYYEAYKVDDIIAKAKEMEAEASRPKKYTPELQIVTDGVVTADLDSFTITYNGESKQLPRKVAHLIHYFISNKGKTVTREQIMNDVWGPDVVVVRTTLDVHIRKIKVALFEDCITTVKCVGYKWVTKN